MSESYTFVNFMVIQIRKLENDGTLFRESWREKFRKRTEPHWSKISLKEVENK